MKKLEVVRARIDKETKKKAMIIVKAKGKNLSEIVRQALEQYIQNN